LNIHEYELEEFSKRYGLVDHELFNVISYFNESDNYWIAGGAVRSFILNKPITTDVDFFFNNHDSFTNFISTYSCDEKRVYKEFCILENILY